jgi:hypothetical protein
MRINIDLKEDERLRKEIRAMIEGQIISIIRDQLKDIVVSQSSGLTSEKLASMAANEIQKRVNSVTSEGTWREDTKKLEKLIRIEVGKKLDDMEDKILEIAAKALVEATERKLSQMIDTRVELAVTKRLQTLLGR